jgi:hypothetical protein
MDWFTYASTYVPENPEALGFYGQFRMWADDYRFYIIFVCLVAVYYMGFATRFRMPILKMVLLYVLFFIGAMIFSILDVRLPVKSALLLAIAILVLVRVRSRREKPQEE